MKPTHPVELLACAIATQEGYFLAGAMPQIKKNPGDLRYAGQIGASGRLLEIATFRSIGHGTAALYRQLWKQVAEGQTARQIINQWAPANENDTTVYLANVLHWTGLPADTPVLELLPPLERLG